MTDYSVRVGNKDLFIDNGLDKVLSKDCLSLYNIIMLDALKHAMPSCFEYLKTVRKCALHALTEKGGLIEYNMPFTDFPVSYRVLKEEEYKMEAPIGFRRLTLVMKRKTGKIDSMKTRNGIAPNVIHGIDTTLLYLVNSEIDSFPIATIHDSIASHPNNSDVVRAAYNRAIVKLNTGDVLNRISNQIGSGSIFETKRVPEEFILSSKHSLV